MCNILINSDCSLTTRVINDIRETLVLSVYIVMVTEQILLNFITSLNISNPVLDEYAEQSTYKCSPFVHYERACVLDLTMVMTLVAATLPGMKGPMTDVMGPLAAATGLRATVLAKLWRASYLERSTSSSTFMLAFSEASFSTSC